MKLTGIKKTNDELEYVKFYYEEIKEKHKNLEEKYKKLYLANKKNLQDGKKYKALRPKAETMMNMLRQYYETGKMNHSDFEKIEIDYDDPLIYNEEEDFERLELLKWPRELLIVEIQQLRKDL